MLTRQLIGLRSPLLHIPIYIASGIRANFNSTSAAKLAFSINKTKRNIIFLKTFHFRKGWLSRCCVIARIRLPYTTLPTRCILDEGTAGTHVPTKPTTAKGRRSRCCVTAKPYISTAFSEQNIGHCNLLKRSRFKNSIYFRQRLHTFSAKIVYIFGQNRRNPKLR